MQHQQSTSSIHSRPQPNPQYGQVIWSSRVTNPQQDQRVQTQNGSTITNQKKTQMHQVQQSVEHNKMDASSWVDP